MLETHALAKSAVGYRYTYHPAELGRAERAGVLEHPPLKTTGLPAEVDQRDGQLPVVDQGQQGSCGGQATSAWKEQNCYLWSGTKTLLGGRLSRSFPYWDARVREGTFPADAGSSVYDEMMGLYTRGCCSESLMGYDAADATQVPSSAALVEATHFRSGLPCTVDTNPDVMRAVLATGKPVNVGVMLYQSFEDTGPDGIVPIPDTSKEGVLGGHMLCRCGYLLLRSGHLYYILKNSWGVGFGDHGYLYWPVENEVLCLEAMTTPMSPPGQA